MGDAETTLAGSLIFQATQQVTSVNENGDNIKGFQAWLALRKPFRGQGKKERLPPKEKPDFSWRGFLVWRAPKTRVFCQAQWAPST